MNIKKKPILFCVLFLVVSMSISSPQKDTESLSEINKSMEKIRKRVDNRHWQLFEVRLKNPLIEIKQKPYTKSNDYRIIDRFKISDQPQLPIEPNQRWLLFCSQLTNKSNETNQLMSIFHNVWIKNWNTKQDSTKINLISNENNKIFKDFYFNEHDKRIISSILHQNI